MRNDELQEHIASTYFSLRMGMILIALATPVAVVLWGMLWHVEWQNSISAYYFAPWGNDFKYSPYPTRVLFVGLLFALGSFLYLYKGFSKLENVLLNIAGLAAICVAVFPMYAEAGYIPLSGKVHYASALVLFAGVGATALFCHESTLKWVTNKRLKQIYRIAYHVIGIFMIAFPAIGILWARLLGVSESKVFWIETAGIWAFAAFWITKSLELQHTQAESRAIKGTLPAVPPGSPNQAFPPDGTHPAAPIVG